MNPPFLFTDFFLLLLRPRSGARINFSKLNLSQITPRKSIAETKPSANSENAGAADIAFAILSNAADEILPIDIAACATANFAGTVTAIIKVAKEKAITVCVLAYPPLVLFLLTFLIFLVFLIIFLLVKNKKPAPALGGFRFNSLTLIIFRAGFKCLWISQNNSRLYLYWNLISRNLNKVYYLNFL